MLDFGASILLLGGYLNEVALKHLNSVKLGFFKSCFNLLAHFALEFLQVIREFLRADEHLLILIFSFAGFSLNSP